MSNPWDKPATKYRSSKPTIITADWHSIPWADLYIQCKAEQYSAIETAKAENLERYNDWIRGKEKELTSLNPESGAYEGNLTEVYAFVELSSQKQFRIGRLASNSVIEAFIEEHKLKGIAITLLNQITKHLSTFKLSTVSGRDYNKECGELISANALYRQVFRGSEKMLGVYEFLMLDSRSTYLEKQYAAPSKTYCALVPIIMSAFKVHHGVPYSHWEPSELVGVVNTKLLDAMMFDDYEDFSTEDILDARADGLLIKSGTKAGESRNPVHTFKLWGKTSLSGLPEYTQVMLTQIWCAHPQNRTRYMILDPKNWDSIPNALISTEIQATHTPAYVSKLVGEDFPWLQK